MCITELNSNGIIARLKSHVVAKRYSQMYEVDNKDTSSQMAKKKKSMPFLLISLVATCPCMLYQLNINNASFMTERKFT